MDVAAIPIALVAVAAAVLASRRRRPAPTAGPRRRILFRHAMPEAIAHERFVVAAGDGLESGDVAWLLDHAPGELVIVRPQEEERHDRRGHRAQPLAG